MHGRERQRTVGGADEVQKDRRPSRGMVGSGRQRYRAPVVNAVQLEPWIVRQRSAAAAGGRNQGRPPCTSRHAVELCS